jgi:hypothetical protein
MMHRTKATAAHGVAACAVLLCAAAALAAQSPAGAAPSPEWKVYSYAVDGFSASFPAQPQTDKKEIPTQAGAFEMRYYLVQDGDAALVIGVCDYGAAVSGHDPDAVLAGAQKGALDNVQAHLVSGQKITLGANKGVEFEGENTALHLSARLYLVGTTLYQTLIARPIDQPYVDTARFLDSFKLIAGASQ